MPLKDLQRRTKEVGRIRVGLTQEYEKNGKTYRRPVRLDRFRLTTNSADVARSAADAFGGTPARWVGGTHDWQVITDAREVPVVVPPGQPVSQWYELWRGGACQRRCDGERRQPGRGLDAGPCQCPGDAVERMDAALAGEACRPTTRLSVILPDVADLGVWRFESHGYNSAAELAGIAELLSEASARQSPLAATLRVEMRQVRRNAGGKVVTHEFPVAVLEVKQSLREVVALTGGGAFAGALPAVPPARALTAGPARTVGPVPGGAWPTARRTLAELRDIIHSPEVLADHLRDCTDPAELADLVALARLHDDWADTHVLDDPDTGDMLTVKAVLARESARVRDQHRAGGRGEG